jgi:uncharacterized phage protein (TIGR01671 family)
MREIKFRAWIPRFRAWIPSSQTMIRHREVIERAHLLFEGSLNSSDIVMESTGLKDKNGVEIYEGDIVEYKTFYYGKEKEHIVEVKWEKEATDLFGEPDFIGFLARWEGGEVIGNIYENPELLDKD